MADAGQQPAVGTGGSIDEAAAKHADVLTGEPDNQDEGGAQVEGEEPEAEETEESEADAVEEPEDGDDEADAEDDEDSDTSDDEDDDSEGEEDDEGDDEPVFKVKVSGEELEVPQSELIAGYARQADYTKKTQALSEERKAFQAEAESVRAERQQYATLLENLKAQVDSGGEQEPDWDKLYAENPNEWMRQRELHRSRREKREAIEAEQARLRQQQEAERQVQLREHLTEESAKLTEVIPEWADEDKAKEEKQRVVKYATESVGFSEQEVSQIYDHRAVNVLRKAMLYDELVSKRGKVKPDKGERSPRAAKPGTTRKVSTSKARATKKSRERLATTGSLNDAAALIMETLD